MPQFGYHIDPPLANLPAELALLGSATYQTTLRDPRRLSKDGVPTEEDCSAYVAQASRQTIWGMVHASLLTSLGSPDPRIRNGSASALASDANMAARLGMHGVCFHVGYQKGHEGREAAMNAVIYKLKDVLGRLNPGAQVWLENGAEGTELGQTVPELAYVVRGVLAEGADPGRLGLVLDTCHLHVSGFDMSDRGAADELAGQLNEHGLVPFLRALHMNDAQAPCGSRRDRHAIPGTGTIGEGLLRVCAHPLFQGLHAVLEMSPEAAAEGIRFLTGKA